MARFLTNSRQLAVIATDPHIMLGLLVFLHQLNDHQTNGVTNNQCSAHGTLLLFLQLSQAFDITPGRVSNWHCDKCCATAQLNTHSGIALAG